MARAVLLLVAAIAAHLWLVRAPASSTGGADAAVRGGSEVQAVSTSDASIKLVHEDVFISRVVRERSPDNAPERDVEPEQRPPFPIPAVQKALLQSDPESAFERHPDAVRLSEMPSIGDGALPVPALDVARLPDVASINPIPLPSAPVRPAAESTPPKTLAAAKTSAAGRTPELRRQDEESLYRFLRDYTRAYSRLDVEAAKAFWPSLPDRRLQRAFSQLDAQELRLAECEMSFTDRGANAVCKYDATYRPKIGSRAIRRNGAWAFDLTRADDGWQIVDARMR